MHCATTPQEYQKQEYQKLVAAYADRPDIIAGQMFGKPCLKVGGKAFVARHLDAVVFTLEGEHHARALATPGAVLWDPSGKGRPMKEWVAVPPGTSSVLRTLSDAALRYVSTGA